jgi:hypothetical protein
MKTNEAPERLYLSKNIYSTFLYQAPDPDDETAVEYTRTDAFIERALEYLEPILTEYAGFYVGGDILQHFKKYMKG